MAGDNKSKKAPSSKTAAKKRSPWRSMAVLTAAAAIVGTYFYVVQSDGDVGKHSADEEPKDNFKVEKTGSGANVNFSEKTQRIHTLVDEAIKESAADLIDSKQQKKRVNRQELEGEIIWNSRDVILSATDDQVQKLQSRLKTMLNKINAEIISSEKDMYDGHKVLRMDIGIRDKLEGDTVTIIADKLYIIAKSSAKTPPVAKSPPTAEISPRTNDGSAKVALVIDDFGYTEEGISVYRDVKCPLTFAVLPNHPYSKEAAQQGYQDGRQIILHLPMEAMGTEAKEEAKTIHVSMGEDEIRAMVRELTDTVPYIIGVNNHQGSRATSNPRVMRVVLNQLMEQGLFFVDSKTSGSSVAFSIARDCGVPVAENQLFIDNSSDVEAIKNQLKKVAGMARQNGEAIAIGHARPNTAKALKEMIPVLEAQGIRFVFVSTLLQ